MEGGGGRNGWPLDDRGYGIQPYLMTPLRPEGVFTLSQNSYQKAHTKTRDTIVRNCTIIAATAVLHNMYF